MIYVNPQEVTWLLEEKYHGIRSPGFEIDLRRLEAGEPLAYIIGWIEFLGCKIDVTLHPMIPRPETEYWLERAIKELKERGNAPLRLLDMFAGSGCIGVALLKHIPNATADISELDPNLTEELRINIRQNGIAAERAHCFAGNVFEGATGPYDAIFANPPYIDPNAIPEMDDSVINYEPHLSLFAGERGLDYLKILISKGQSYLKDRGVMYIECDAHQRDWITELLTGTTWKYEFWNDQYDQVRFLILRK